MELEINTNMSARGQSKFSLYFTELHRSIEHNGKIN